MRIELRTRGAGPDGVMRPGDIIEVSDAAALRMALNDAGVFTLQPPTLTLSTEEPGSVPLERGVDELRQLHDLTNQYDAIRAQATELETVNASQLDSADLGDDLLNLAHTQAEREMEARSLRLAMDSVHRRFDALAGGLVDSYRHWARQKLSKAQPELDEKAEEAVKTVSKLAQQLRDLRDAEDALRDRVGLGPSFVWFPEMFVESLENRLAFYEREKAERAQGK